MTDDIAKEIFFQSFEDHCRMLDSLLQEVLQREVRSQIMEKIERTRILAQVIHTLCLSHSLCISKLPKPCLVAEKNRGN
ncbi:hypothetical protein ACFX15_007972 [Malus domestica]